MTWRTSEEGRRQRDEWLDRQEPPWVTFDRVQKRIAERRARREQSFFRRLFRRAA